MKTFLTLILMGPGVLVGFILGWLWWTFKIGIDGAQETLEELLDWADHNE